MYQTMRYRETLRKLTMIHEGLVQDTARLVLDLARASALDSKTAPLLLVGVAAAIGSSAACLRGRTIRPGMSSRCAYRGGICNQISSSWRARRTASLRRVVSSLR